MAGVISLAARTFLHKMNLDWAGGETDD